MTETPYSDLHDMEQRDQRAAQVESEASIRRLIGPADAPRMSRERATMIARLAARNIRADETNTLGKARALTQAMNVEFNEQGDPQRFPYDNASSAAVRAAMALDAAGELDREVNAHIREVAASVREHREAYRRGHTIHCRGDLYRGFCH